MRPLKTSETYTARDLYTEIEIIELVVSCKWSFGQNN